MLLTLLGPSSGISLFTEVSLINIKSKVVESTNKQLAQKWSNNVKHMNDGNNLYSPLVWAYIDCVLKDSTEKHFPLSSKQIHSNKLLIRYVKKLISMSNVAAAIHVPYSSQFKLYIQTRITMDDERQPNHNNSSNKDSHMTVYHDHSPCVAVRYHKKGFPLARKMATSLIHIIAIIVWDFGAYIIVFTVSTIIVDTVVALVT